MQGIETHRTFRSHHKHACPIKESIVMRVCVHVCDECVVDMILVTFDVGREMQRMRILCFSHEYTTRVCLHSRML